MGQRQYPDRSLVECSEASANAGDLPFYSSEALVDCVEALVQVDRGPSAIARLWVMVLSRPLAITWRMVLRR
jgi:hypothetical protein